MSILTTITYDLEFEIAGVWTSMKSATSPSYFDSKSALTFNRGVGADRKMQVATMSFNLDNSDEAWTPGNTAGAMFNKVRKGTNVRFSTTYLGTKKYWFTGVVASIRVPFPDFAPAKMRAYFTCEGLTSLLREYKTYGMALQSGVDVDDALTAIMVACGVPSYLFADSDFILPFVFPKSDALSDMVGVAGCDPTMLLFEDGQGRPRTVQMTGGNHASPAFTLGSTIAPEGEVSPDYRKDSQFARVVVNASTYKPTTEDVVLYRHPINFEGGFAEPLPGYSRRVIAGVFEQMPVSVVTQFSQTIIEFQDTADSLGATIDSSSTTLYTSSAFVAPTTFNVGDEIRVDQEVMAVTAVLTPAYYQQKLTVTRGQRGTVAAAHSPQPPAGTRLYKRAAVEVLTQITPPYNAYLNVSMGFASNQANLVNAGTTLAINDLIKIDAEVIKITGISGAPIYNVSRAQMGTTAVTHASGAAVRRWTLQAVEGTLGTSYIRASEFASGLPAENPDITGNPVYPGAQHILVTGNKFTADIYNNDSATRYLADLVIGGKALKPNEKTAKVAYEKAIPYILGMPEAPAVSMAFGATALETVKGYAHQLLRAGRVPTPWLAPSFMANVSDNVSLLTAELGDLSRYTGTGTYREKIDEWYRTVAINGTLDEAGVFRLTFTLAPSHLWREPTQAWYTDFNWGVASGVLGLGVFDVSPPGLWNNIGNWTRVIKSGRYEATMAVANPSPAVVDVGTGDQRVFAHIAFNSSPCTYPVNTGGMGVTFRANASTPTTWWEARFNPTQSLIYLWNTNDGVVASVAWTATSSPEIEVDARANRIRVYVDCNAEPVIDTETYSPAISSTIKNRYSTQTYAGPAAEVTSLAGSPVQPTFKDWGAHGL